VPGEAQFSFRTGTVSITYREAKNYATPVGILFDEPPALRVEIANASRGETLEIKRFGVAGLAGVKAASGRGFTRKLLGTVEVRDPGLHTVKAYPELPNAVEPQILLSQ
jgi:hypothetical protein